MMAERFGERDAVGDEPDDPVDCWIAREPAGRLAGCLLDGESKASSGTDPKLDPLAKIRGRGLTEPADTASSDPEEDERPP